MDNPPLRRLLAVAAFALCALVTMGSETQRAPGSGTTPGPEAWYAGVPAFTALEGLPYLRRGVQTHQFCSYDRAGDNYDADYFPICADASGEGGVFDAYGPGCLYGLQMNNWHGDVKGINIRFYFDDEPKAQIDMDVTTFFSTNNPLRIFQAPLAHVAHGYRLLYHPFFFAKRLRVALSREPIGPAPGWDKLPWEGHYKQHPARRNHWYQFTYHTFTENPGLSSWTHPPDMAPVIAMWNPTNMASPPQPVAGAVPTPVRLPRPAGATRRRSNSRSPGRSRPCVSRLRPKMKPPCLTLGSRSSSTATGNRRWKPPSVACSAPTAPRRRSASPRASSARRVRKCIATCRCRSGSPPPSAFPTAAPAR